MQPILITLNRIRAHSPCASGWKTIVQARGGDPAPFPLADALESNGLDDVLWALRCLPEHNNLWRKYAIWCARRVVHLGDREVLEPVLDVAWRHSEGLATDGELADARRKAWAARAAETETAWAAARAAAAAAEVAAAWAAARAAAWAAARAAAAAAEVAAEAAEAAAWAAERQAQQEKLAQILLAGEWISHD